MFFCTGTGTLNGERKKPSGNGWACSHQATRVPRFGWRPPPPVAQRVMCQARNHLGTKSLSDGLRPISPGSDLPDDQCAHHTSRSPRIIHLAVDLGKTREQHTGTGGARYKPYTSSTARNPIYWWVGMLSESRRLPLPDVGALSARPGRRGLIAIPVSAK